MFVDGISYPSKGETIGPTEATETFFAMTKLFQNKDVGDNPIHPLIFQTTLRKMVFLTIKEMAKIAQDVIIVTSRYVNPFFWLLIPLDSLTKDMTGKEDAYRAGAIRALCRITDVRALAAPYRLS